MSIIWAHFCARSTANCSGPTGGPMTWNKHQIGSLDPWLDRHLQPQYGCRNMLLLRYCETGLRLHSHTVFWCIFHGVFFIFWCQMFLYCKIYNALYTKCFGLWHFGGCGIFSTCSMLWVWHFFLWRFAPIDISRVLGFRCTPLNKFGIYLTSSPPQVKPHPLSRKVAWAVQKLESTSKLIHKLIGKTQQQVFNLC